MRISSMSIVYLGINGAVGALNAYANPTRWIAAFAVGVLVGATRGKLAYDTTIHGKALRNDKFGGVQLLLNSMPGVITTIVNLFAMQLRNFAAGSRLERYSGDLAAASLGLLFGQLLYLDKLRRSQSPQVMNKLKRAVV
jgi:hypothetical protein